MDAGDIVSICIERLFMCIGKDSNLNGISTNEMTIIKKN